PPLITLFFTHTTTTAIYTLSLHDALPILGIIFVANSHVETRDMIQEMNLNYFLGNPQQALVDELLLRFKPNLMDPLPLYIVLLADRKSTRLNSSHVAISYAVFCLKKKTQK